MRLPASSALAKAFRYIVKPRHWPTLNFVELLDQAGGHIGVGRMPPIEGAAVAVTETDLIASLVRRDGESFPELLQRLDVAIGKALHEGVVTNEVYGGRVRLAPPARPQKTMADPANLRRTAACRRPGNPAAAMRPGLHA
ncbi:MAG: hypothetical protein ACRELG_22835 [Gemmataceae bacterium]